MDKAEVLATIHRTRILPVLRADSVDEALTLAHAVAAGGLPVLEITMTIPGALEVIRILTATRPDLLLGAGTVLDPETARMCILEGARFVVSPALNPATIELCQRHSVAVLPGALTPTEIVTAWQAGADVIKLFPAGSMGGPSYIKSLKAPLPDIPLLPTGGVSLGNASQFLEAGAFALGIGAELADLRALRQGRAHDITEKAAAFRHAAQAAAAQAE